MPKHSETFILPLFFMSFIFQMTSYGLFRQYEMLAVSGPTWDQVPAFEWSTSPYSSLMHTGHPDRWDFPTVHVKWSE